MSILFFSDLHGNLQAWECVKRAAAEPDVTYVFCLGDLIDRGLSSCRIVIEFAELMRKEPRKWFFILGNHEQMLLSYLHSKVVSLPPEPPYDSAYFWDTWTDNGGDSVCWELHDKLPGTITTFLKAFVYIISNGCYKVLIQTPGALYNCSHAGPATPDGCRFDTLEESSRRLWSRMDVDYVGVTGSTERLTRPSLRPGPGEGAKIRIHSAGNRKFYIFGHTPTHEDIIIAEWENSYRTYDHAFLRIDAGLAYSWHQVAIGKITPGASHSVEIKEVREMTALKTYPDTYGFRPNNNPILSSWRNVWRRLTLKQKGGVDNIMKRSMTMSWVDGWAKIWKDSYPTAGERIKGEAYYAHYDHLMKVPEFRMRTITEGIRTLEERGITDVRRFDFSPSTPVPLIPNCLTSLNNYITNRENEWDLLCCIPRATSKARKLAAARWAHGFLQNLVDNPREFNAFVARPELQDELIQVGGEHYESLRDGKLYKVLCSCPGGKQLFDRLKRILLNQNVNPLFQVKNIPTETRRGVELQRV